MKISGGDHLVVTHTWSKNYFSNIKLTGLKVDCPKMPLSQNAQVSPTIKVSNAVNTILAKKFLSRNLEKSKRLSYEK